MDRAFRILSYFSISITTLIVQPLMADTPLWGADGNPFFADEGPDQTPPSATTNPWDGLEASLFNMTPVPGQNGEPDRVQLRALLEFNALDSPFVQCLTDQGFINDEQLNSLTSGDILIDDQIRVVSESSGQIHQGEVFYQERNGRHKLDLSLLITNREMSFNYEASLRECFEPQHLSQSGPSSGQIPRVIPASVTRPVPHESGGIEL